MVSFWPWRGNDSSTASFEKTLSALSTKITDSQGRLDRLRASSRRVRVLGTLYLSFAYILYAIIVLVVVGWKDMGAYEWTGMAGGPLIIYLTRMLLSGYYNFRIDGLSAQLKTQQDERAKTIQKLKAATKYDSTLELLQKYGGAENKGKAGSDANEGAKRGKQQNSATPRGTPGRTNLPPPPTANIRRPEAPPSHLGTPSGRQSPFQPQPSMPSLEPGEEFAPNAFGRPPPPDYTQYEPQQYQQQQPGSSHWYDRIMDLILGEDETAPKNRIVLICARCRLVNGQAPPGTESLAQVGTWKCMGCGALNGEMDEGKKIVEEVLGQTQIQAEAKAPKASSVTPEMSERHKSPVGDGTEDESSDLVEVERESDGSS